MGGLLDWYSWKEGVHIIIITYYSDIIIIQVPGIIEGITFRNTGSRYILVVEKGTTFLNCICIIYMYIHTLY